MAGKFTIPPEFQGELEHIEVTDTRSTKEIIATLREHVPVTSEKNIWAYWHAGVDALPGWCKRNIADWEMLPEAFVNGSMEGPYTGPHSADFLRGALIYTHGGVNMDVGVFLFRHMDRICWSELEDPASPYRIAVPLMYGNIIANHFVAARKGDRFIKLWHDLFVHLWKGRTSHKGLSEDPLISFVKEFQFADAEAFNFNWDFKVSPTEVMEYITQVSCWSRMCMLEGNGTGGEDDFNGSEYWQAHVLCPNVLEENWGAEAVLGFSSGGQGILDALTTPLDADPESPEYKRAAEVIWRMLARSSLQKVTHGKGLTNTVALGTLLDEKPEADFLPGTFGELLRYGAVNFRQKRETIVTIKPQKAKATFKKGVYEA